MPGKEWTIPKEKSNKRDILLVFARAPERGRVKTRLAKDLGPDKALDLYRGFVSQTLTTAKEWAGNRKTGGAGREIWVCYTPAEKESAMKAWLGRDFTFWAQADGDIGDRMASAMAAAFESARGFFGTKVILVGSDIPDMTASHLEAACEALDHTDLVWGPSLDGGYWLVGASGPDNLRGIFSEIPWSTDRVLSKTLEKCRTAERTWTVLPPLQDVDTVSDLKTTAFYKTIQREQ